MVTIESSEEVGVTMGVMVGVTTLEVEVEVGVDDVLVLVLEVVLDDVEAADVEVLLEVDVRPPRMLLRRPPPEDWAIGGQPRYLIKKNDELHLQSLTLGCWDQHSM